MTLHDSDARGTSALDRSALPMTVSTQATDAASAAAAMSTVYDELTVSPGSQLRLRMSLKCLGLPSARLAELGISTSLVVTKPYPNYIVVTTTSGRAALTVEGATERIPAHGSLVIVPGRPLRVDYSGHFSKVLTLELDRTALEGELSAMLGRTVSSAIRFAPGPGLTDPDNPFSRAFRLVRAEVSAPAGLLAHPVTAGHLTRLLMSGLLLGHRHAYSEELRRPVGFVGPRAIREAVTIIEEAPMEIASVADIARKVGLSVRALEVGFRRHLDTTPMRYARRTRMARAHGELRSGDPDRTTAGAVAQHWGFGHYGRFVSEYRQRYGHTPAETLRTPALGDDGGASDRGSRW